MENAPQFVATDGQRQNGFDPAMMRAKADAATHRKIDEVLRAAYKKFGCGKFTQQALARGLGKQRRKA